MPNASNTADRLRTRARRGPTAFQSPSVSLASITKDDQYVYVEAATSGFPNGVDRIEWDLLDFFNQYPDQPFADDGTGRTVKLEHNGPGKYMIRVNAFGPQGTQEGTVKGFTLSEIPDHQTGGGLSTAAIAVGGLALAGVAAVSLR